tara:strand:- start:4306 stop:4845 length:540 start_codon:yes stop_codon:yes gene_type:complete
LLQKGDYLALDAESIGYVLLFILVVVFTVFPLTAFIYSMIFARFHHASNHKKLLSREKYVMQSLGKDNLHTLSTPVPNRKISKAGLVMSNITVAPSWWQLFLGTIRSIFGGKVESYDKVLAYGRSEVMQRLREQAIGEGWDEVINVRVETSMVMNKVKGKNMNKSGTLEFLAYGTGIRE